MADQEEKGTEAKLPAWHMSQTTFVSDFTRARSNEELTDVVLVARCGKKFPVHSMILKIRSEYFQGFFRRMPAEKLVDGDSRDYIKIDQDADILEIVLEFIYGKISDFSDYETGCEILEVADVYLLTGLQDIAGHYLSTFANSDNLVELLNLATRYNNKTLLRKLKEAICPCDNEKELEPCEFMISNTFADLTEEGFKFFLRSGIKVHKTNVFVRRVHQYWSHEKHVEHKVGKFPLDDFKDKIDWSNVSSNYFECIDANGYLSPETLSKILLKRTVEGDRELSDSKKELKRTKDELEQERSKRARYDSDMDSTPERRLSLDTTEELNHTDSEISGRSYDDSSDRSIAESEDNRSDDGDGGNSDLNDEHDSESEIESENEDDRSNVNSDDNQSNMNSPMNSDDDDFLSTSDNEG